MENEKIDEVQQALLEEFAETDGFYTESVRKTVKDKRKLSEKIIKLQGHAGDDADTFRRKAAAGIVFALSKSRMKNDILTGLADSGGVSGRVIRLGADMTVRGLMDQMETCDPGVFREAAERHSFKANEYIPVFRNVIFWDRAASGAVRAEHPDTEFFADSTDRSVRCRYAAELYTDGYAEMMLQQTAAFMDAAEDAPLGDIDVMPQSETERLRSFEGGSAALPEDITVLDMIKEQVLLRPDDTAVEDGERSISYAELDEAAGRIASYVYEKMQGRKGFAGICMDQCMEQMKAVLGIQKAGCAFIPIDDEIPEERIRQIVEDSGMSVIFTDAVNYGRLRELQKTCPQIENILLMDREDEILEGRKAGECPAEVRQEDTAYAIYTSGTTGRPKGVAISHRALLDFCICQKDICGIVPSDRMARYVRVGFDPSVFEMFPFWTNGAAVVSMPAEIRMDLDAVNDFLEEKKITHIILPTQVCEQFQRFDNKSLKVLITGGDKLRSCGGGHSYRLLNNYGPTENTITTTVFEVDREYRNIPIGRPIGNCRVYIVDQYGRRQPAGIPGELWIAGERLAQRYINNEKLTKELFFESSALDDKVYRSGDMARWLPDGNLEFKGRIDKQVKISAFRIEIEEVESSIKVLDDIKQCIVTVCEDAAGSRFLCGYYVTDRDDGEEYIREMLMKNIPAYMIPKCLMRLDEIPYNRNGKVEYSRLPEPVMKKAERVMPETEDERMIRDIWKEILGHDDFGVTDNFFSIGGNSIQAMQFAAEWNQTGKRKLRFGEFMAHPDIRSAAAVLRDRDAEEDGNGMELVPSTDQEHRYEPFPLTQMQQAYFVGRRNEMELGSVPTHSYVELLCGDYSRERFEKAAEMLMRRHDVLHSRFTADGRQYILRDAAADIKFEDLSAADGEEKEKRLAQIREEMSSMMPDCLKEPLFCMRVSETGEGRAVIHMYSDGLLIDGWSLELLIKDLNRFYEEPDKEPAGPDMLFRDYVLFFEKLRETEKYRKCEAYWAGRIPELPGAPALPMKKDTGSGMIVKKYSGTLTMKEWEDFSAACARAGFSSFIVLLTVFGEVAARWSSTDRFCINVPTFNRAAAGGMADEIIGECASFFLFEIESGNETFREKLEKNRRQLTELLENDLYTGIDVQRRIAQERGSVGSFTIPVVFTSLLDIPFERKGTITKNYVMTHTSQVWIDAVAQFCDGMVEFSWDCVENIFEEGVIGKMIRAFTSQLKKLGSDDRIWEEKICIEADEDRAVAEALNSEVMEMPSESLGELMLQSAVRYQDDISAVQGDRSVTYREFFGLAGRHLDHMRQRGVSAGDTVAILLEKSFDQLAAVTAAVLAGAVYMPMDVQMNSERTGFCIAESEAVMVVCDDDTEELARMSCGDAEVYNVSRCTGPVPSQMPVCTPRTQEDLFCLIYTSGSTGDPKGVMIPQRGLISAVAYTNQHYGITGGDSVLSLTNLSHDMSMYDLFGMIAAGGCIILPEKTEVRNPEHWIEMINRYKATFWNSAPAFMEMILEVMEYKGLECLSTVRTAVMGGDVMRKKIPQALWKINPEMTVVNVGGPTETTLWNIHHVVTEEDMKLERIPYGRPMANTGYFILNEKLELCPLYTEGVMYVEGAGVTKGYLNDPGKTAQKYMTNPYTGNLMYCTGDVGRYLGDGTIDIIGRNDFQIKINGKRIELGEIEQTAYRSCSIVSAAAVHRKQENAIALFYRSEDAAEDDVRKILEETLPDYMIPKYIVRTDDIPLSRNGKIDRKKLAAVELEAVPETENISGEAADGQEMELIGLYNSIIGTSQTRPGSNFFSLGGDSLKAIKLLYAVNEKFDTELSLTDIFNNPSVRKLSEHISSISGRRKELMKIGRYEGSEIPLGYAQEGIWFVDRSLHETGSQRYNLVGSVVISDDLDVDRFTEAVAYVADNCDAVNVEIHEKDYIPYQTVNRSSRTVLECVYHEDLSAAELKARFEEEESERIYSLDKAPLYHFRLGRAADGRYVFTTGIHHILVDAYSIHLLIQNIKEEYFRLLAGDERREDEESITFHDFAVWQRKASDEGLFDDEISYWKEKLSGELTHIELSDVEQSAWGSFEGEVYDIDISGDDVRALREICRKSGMTVFAGLTTVFCMFLEYLCGADDICIGTAVSGRTRSEIKTLAGNFANVLLLRTQAGPDDSFSTLSVKVRDTINGAYGHQSLPFEKIAREIKLDYSYLDLPYKILIDYIDLEDEEDSTFGVFEYTNTMSAVDLDFFIQSMNDEFRFQFYYKNSLFTREDVEEFGDIISDILKEVIDDPERPLDEFSLLQIGEDLEDN